MEGTAPQTRCNAGLAGGTAEEETHRGAAAMGLMLQGADGNWWGDQGWNDSAANISFAMGGRVLR